MFENPASGAGWADEAWPCGGTVLCVSVGNTWHSWNPRSFTAAGEDVNIFKLKNHSGSRRTPVWKAKGGQIFQLHYICVSNPVAGHRGQVRCSVLSDTGGAKTTPPNHPLKRPKPSVMSPTQQSCLCLWKVQPGSQEGEVLLSRPWIRAGVISVGSCVASQGMNSHVQKLQTY